MRLHACVDVGERKLVQPFLPEPRPSWRASTRAIFDHARGRDRRAVEGYLPGLREQAVDGEQSWEVYGTKNRLGRASVRGTSRTIFSSLLSTQHCLLSRFVCNRVIRPPAFPIPKALTSSPLSDRLFSMRLKARDLTIKADPDQCDAGS